MDSYLEPWDPFVIRRDLLGRVKGVWDVIVLLQGRRPHLTSWVTTQTPLTHHWLQGHLSSWSREHFTVLSPPLAFCAHLPHDSRGLVFWQSRPASWHARHDIKSRSPQVELISTGYLWDWKLSESITTSVPICIEFTNVNNCLNNAKLITIVLYLVGAYWRDRKAPAGFNG